MPTPVSTPSVSAAAVHGRWRWSQKLRRAALVLGLAVTAVAPAVAKESAPALPTIALESLPQQGQKVYRLIHEGGPFRYDKDGSVFGNRERILPQRPRGYYREYTVPTPGERTRGARRIVCGGEAPQKPLSCYYTDDHYASFKRIVASDDGSPKSPSAQAVDSPSPSSTFKSSRSPQTSSTAPASTHAADKR